MLWYLELSIFMYYIVLSHKCQTKLGKCSWPSLIPEGFHTLTPTPTVPYPYPQGLPLSLLLPNEWHLTSSMQPPPPHHDDDPQPQPSLSWPWYPINPVPLCLITSMHLPPVLLYVALFPDCPYSLCITTNRWVLCLVRLPLWLLNMFPFTIPVTLCSCPIILTNMIRLGESAMSITELTHHTARTALVIGLPDPLSITLYILQ